MFYWFMWGFVKALRVLCFPLKVYGRENIPAEGAFILASNHVSHLDPMVIPISCHRRLSFVAKESLFKSWPLGAILRGLDAYPIRRGASDLKAVKSILARLKQGTPVTIFPEGTRARPGAQRKVQAGIGLVVVRSHAPVVPVYIEGTDKVLRPGARWLRYVPVKIYFGLPIYFKEKETYPVIAEKIMERVYQLPKEMAA